LRRLILFPVAAGVTAAMMVVSAVPALGDYLERLARPENECEGRRQPPIGASPCSGRATTVKFGRPRGLKDLLSPKVS